MSLLRLIARLDIKGPNVVKGVQMEGLRVVGKPADLARKYSEEADELIYIDTVSSLYGRNQLEALLEQTTRDVFIPVTVAGGIKSGADVRRLLGAGADKVAINTAAIARPLLIDELAHHYGSQCICVSIEAKRIAAGWEAYTDNGRERTRLDAVRWAEEVVGRGCGELLITSVDRDGTMKGFDVELVREITARVSVPVVACGGMGTIDHLHEVLTVGGAGGAAMASVLHYGKLTIKEMGDGLAERKFFDQRKGRGGRSEERCYR